MNTARYNENTAKPCGFYCHWGLYFNEILSEVRSVRGTGFFCALRTQIILFSIVTLVESFTRFLSPLFLLSYRHIFFR
jgi:hypothetical protein